MDISGIKTCPSPLGRTGDGSDRHRLRRIYPAAQFRHYLALHRVPQLVGPVHPYRRRGTPVLRGTALPAATKIRRRGTAFAGIRRRGHHRRPGFSAEFILEPVVAAVHRLRRTLDAGE